MLRRLELIKTDGILGTMLDYEDFNYQHTLEAQSLVFNVIRSLMSPTLYPSDLFRAVQWCAGACLNQWCTFPGDTKPIRITQGLFSGQRGTNFLNTILNCGYFLIAKRHVFENLGLNPVSLYTIHHGDDVWITNRCPLWASALYIVVLASGFKFGWSKQLFDYNRGEFLRVLYTKDGAFGFLGRAVPSFILKLLQGQDINSPAGIASAANDQLSVLSRRGLSDACVTALWNSTIPYIAGSSLNGHLVSIPVGILRKSYRDGGLDLGLPRTLPITSVNLAPLPVMATGSIALESAIPMNMSRDWVSVISSKIKVPFDSEAVTDALHKVNVCDSLKPQDRQEHLTRHLEDISEWKHSLDSVSGRRSGLLYSKVFLRSRDSRRIDLLLSKFNNILGKKKDSFRTHYSIEIIFSAIASSPFRDAATASRAFNCSNAEAVDYCVLNCRNPTLRTSALLKKSAIIHHTSEDVFNRIMSGIRIGMTSFNCEWHPNVLSWFQTFCLEATIQQCMARSIRSSKGWDTLLEYNTSLFLSQLHDNPEFLTISK